MADFLKEYKNWEEKDFEGKKQLIRDCASFYEEKAVMYVLSSLPKKKQKEFKKDPIVVGFLDNAQKEVGFGDNEIYVVNSFVEQDKKTVCFKVAQNTICAVFVHLFYNTASDPNKKTKFGSIANGFLASITSEFAKGNQFEIDMMQAYEEVLGEVMDMGPAMEA